MFDRSYFTYLWLTRRFGGADKASQYLHVSIAWEHIIVLPLSLFAYLHMLFASVEGRGMGSMTTIRLHVQGAKARGGL